MVLIGSRVRNLNFPQFFFKISVRFLQSLVTILNLFNPDLEYVELRDRRVLHALDVVLQFVDFAPEIIDVLLCVGHILLQHLNILYRALDLVVGHTLHDFLVHLLEHVLDAVHLVQSAEDVGDLLLLLVRLRGRCIPFCDVLLGYFWTGRSFSSDFDGLTTLHGLDHLPQLVALLVEGIRVHLVALDLLELEKEIVQLLLVLVEELGQVVDLLLLVLIFCLQGGDLGQQFIPQAVKFLVEFRSELVHHFLKGV